MLRFTLPAVAALLATALFGSHSAADDAERTTSYKLTSIAKLTMVAGGQEQKLDGDTALEYTWARSGDKRRLELDSLMVKMDTNGKPTMNTAMSRDKMTNTVDGKTQEFAYKDANDQLKSILKGGFKNTLCTVTVDEAGREVKREVTDDADAKLVIDQGMIANGLLFHPPFVPGKPSWKAPAEVSMGNGGFAKGDLTYQPVEGGDGNTVTVSGTLTNASYAIPNNPLTIKNAKYVVAGKQTYDPKKAEWASGDLAITVTFIMNQGDNLAATAKGTMAMTLARVPGK